jgi:hypothetical protein
MTRGSQLQVQTYVNRRSGDLAKAALASVSAERLK